MATRTPRAPRVELTLTTELIRESVPRDSSHCMFAEAVKAAYPDASHVSVDLQTIRFTDPKKGLRFTYLTPRVAQVALIKFDQGIAPEPLTCRLRGGQVTRSGRTGKASPKKMTPAQIKQRKAAAAKGHDTMSRARLVSRNTSGEVPDRIGGKTPPSTPFARRRAFGLRALEH